MLNYIQQAHNIDHSIEYKILIIDYGIFLYKLNDNNYYEPVECIAINYFGQNNSVKVFNKTPISDSLVNIQEIIDDCFNDHIKINSQIFIDFKNYKDNSDGSKTVSIIKDKIETLTIFE